MMLSGARLGCQAELRADLIRHDEMRQLLLLLLMHLLLHAPNSRVHAERRRRYKAPIHRAPSIHRALSNVLHAICLAAAVVVVAAAVAVAVASLFGRFM